MKNIKFLAIGLIVASLVMLTACGSDGSTTDSTGDNANNEANTETKEPVTLELGFWTVSANIEKAFEFAAEQHKKDHENVDLTITAVPHENYWTKMQTSLSGGQGPDIFWINGPNFQKFASLGLIENLQPFIDADDEIDLNAYSPGMVDLYKYDGQIYGIPHVMGPLALYYNKAMFDEAGIDYPDETWTWEDIKKYGKQLSNPADNTYGFLTHATSSVQQTGLYPLVHQAGGVVINEDSTESGFGTPETTAALEFLRTLVEDGIHPPLSTLQETDVTQLFASERAAMYPSGSWDVAPFSEALGDKLGIAVLPHNKERGYLIHGSAFVVNANSEYKQEAYEMVKTLTGLEAQTFLAEGAYNFPAHVDAVEKWGGEFSVDLSAFRDGLEHTGAFPVSLDTAQWQDIISIELAKVLTSKSTAEEASNSIAEQMNAVLEKEGK